MNETTRTRDLPGLALALCGLVLGVGVVTVFKACAPGEDGMWMHCHDVQAYLAILGAVIAACGLARLAFKQPGIRLVLAVVALVAAVAAVVLPGVLPMCMMDTMRCRAIMTPFARIMGVASAAASLACLFLRRQEH